MNGKKREDLVGIGKDVDEKEDFLHRIRAKVSSHFVFSVIYVTDDDYVQFLNSFVLVTVLQPRVHSDRKAKSY